MSTVIIGPGGTGSATKSRQDGDGKDDEEKTKMRGETACTASAISVQDIACNVLET